MTTPRRTHRMTRQPLTLETIAAVRAAGLAGTSCTAIAKTLHISRTAVTKILDETGIHRERHDEPAAPPYDPRPWSDDALCLQVDPEIFHPEKGDKGAFAKAAKRVCARCPVLYECREWALTQPGPIGGIWGGLSERERRPLRHGTAA